MRHPKTSLLRPSLGWDFACVEGFRPKSPYIFAYPEEIVACHSCCQVLTFRLFNCRFALLRNCVLRVWILGGVLAYFPAFLSAISFSSIPIHREILSRPDPLSWSGFYSIHCNSLQSAPDPPLSAPTGSGFALILARANVRISIPPWVPRLTLTLLWSMPELAAWSKSLFEYLDRISPRT